MLKVRYKGESGKYIYGESSDFNTCGVGEVITYFDDNSCDSMFIHSLEVQLKSGEWKSMQKAFADKDILPNNHNTSFDYPRSNEEKEQGFNW